MHIRETLDHIVHGRKYRKEAHEAVRSIEMAYRDKGQFDRFYHELGINDATVLLRDQFVFDGTPFAHWSSRREALSESPYFHTEEFAWIDEGVSGQKGIKMIVSKEGSASVYMTINLGFSQKPLILPEYMDTRLYHKNYYGTDLGRLGIKPDPLFDRYDEMTLVQRVQFARTFAHAQRLAIGIST